MELQQLQLKDKDVYYDVMIQDMVSLLVKKGFEDFKNMNVDITIPIDAIDYFRFNVDPEIALSFNSALSINGGKYYEFK